MVSKFRHFYQRRKHWCWLQTRYCRFESISAEYWRWIL